MYTEMFLIFFVRGVTRGGGKSRGAGLPLPRWWDDFVWRQQHSYFVGENARIQRRIS